MPFTINGIGTHYYGKSNVVTRSGICPHCQQATQLVSYDTRLWFVVVFIPVIPLGRKRVLDRCYRCNLHSVVNPEQWKAAQQANAATALQTFGTEPSPATALEAHARLLAFHQHNEAAALRQAVLAQFYDDGSLFAAFGQQLDAAGYENDAVPLLERALALEPELLPVRTAVAWRRMWAGRLDEARQLLAFLEQPGAGRDHSLAALDQLAELYQRAGRHAEALQLCEQLLREQPHVGQIPHFRRFVQKSERALGRQPSILPPTLSRRARKQLARSVPPSSADAGAQRFTMPTGFWTRRRAAVVVVLALLGLLGLTLSNEYLRRHRTVHIVNALGAPVAVSLDGRPPFQVVGRTTVTLAEGPHRAVISGSVEEQIPFVLQAGYFERWFRSPLWVVNVDQLAVLATNTVYYSTSPRPPETRYEVGQAFLQWKHVDYAFETPPTTLRVDSHSRKAVRKIHVDLLSLPPSQLVSVLAGRDSNLAFWYAMRRAARAPNDGDLLAALVSLAGGIERMEEARQLLHTGLMRRPVSVAWHMAYQDLTTSNPQGLAEEYAGFVAQEPDNAALTYLQARLTPDSIARETWLERARELDPELAWPWLDLGFIAAARGDWPAARELLLRAKALRLESFLLDELLHTVRLASGEAETLEQEYQVQQATRAIDLPLLLRRCDALAVLGRQAELPAVVEAWETWCRAVMPADFAEAQRVARASVAILRDDLPALEAVTAAADGSMERLAWLLLADRAREAAEDEALQPLLHRDLRAVLSLTLALMLTDDPGLAETWLDQSCQLLESQAGDGARAAAILRTPEPPTDLDVSSVSLTPDYMAVWLALVARRFPDAAPQWNAAAQQLNVSRRFPYPLVARAIAAVR